MAHQWRAVCDGHYEDDWDDDHGLVEEEAAVMRALGMSGVAVERRTLPVDGLVAAEGMSVSRSRAAGGTA